MQLQFVYLIFLSIFSDILNIIKLIEENEMAIKILLQTAFCVANVAFKSSTIIIIY